jgi:hypothetical protein
MRRLRGIRPSPALGVSLVALGVAAGGVAYAGIPSSDGTIHACYANDTGALRVVDRDTGGPIRDCERGSTGLSWSQRGPAGAQGPQGVQRAPGPARAPELRTVFDDDTGIICNKGCDEGSLLLTAGSWMISAKILLLQKKYGRPLSVACKLRAGDDTDVAATVAYGANSARRAETTLSMHVVHTQSGPARAYLWCTDGATGDVVGEHLKITAIGVGVTSKVGL